MGKFVFFLKGVHQLENINNDFTFNYEKSIEESFIDFIESHEKIGQGLSMEFIEKLQADDLDIKDCRGQGYDNVSTMSGKYQGLQAQIKNKNSLARYVPCMAHTLNLVGVHAAEVSSMMITFFGIV